MAIEAPAATPDSSISEAEAPAKAVAASSDGTTQVKADGQTQQASEAKPAVEKLSIMGVEIDKAKVPPELLEKMDGWNKAYTEKSQRLSEAEKKAAALDQLSNNAAFQKWYYEQINGSQNQPPAEDPYKLTAERQAELLSDPDKMRSYIEGLATKIVNEYAVPAANQARLEAQTLRNETMVAKLADKHKDFDELNSQGKIEEVVAKYAKQGVDIDLEDAYWLAKRTFVETEAELKAHQRVQDKVNGSTLQPTGAPADTGIKPVSGKGLSFEEKMRVAAEHAYRGEKIKFVD